MQSLLYQLAAALVIGTCADFSAAGDQPTTLDWERVGGAARDRCVPILMVVTGNGCGYCERLQRQLLEDPAIRNLVSTGSLIRFYHRDTGGKITDFDGERLRAAVFISRYEIYAIPTLLFLDPHGRQIADPLVGYNSAAGYRDLVTDRLDRARMALQIGEGAGGLDLAGAHP